ncbi:hypothetical protein ACFVTC_34130 [Streptomyces sp. NPDC057950]
MLVSPTPEAQPSGLDESEGLGEQADRSEGMRKDLRFRNPGARPMHP